MCVPEILSIVFRVFAAHPRLMNRCGQRNDLCWSNDTNHCHDLSLYQRNFPESTTAELSK